MISPSERILNRVTDTRLNKKIKICSYFLMQFIVHILVVAIVVPFLFLNFLLAFFLLPIFIVLYTTVVPFLVIYTVYFPNNRFVALVRAQMIPPNHNSWTQLRYRKRFHQRNAGPEAKRVRTRLRRQLYISSRIEVLRINSVCMWTFDALSYCLGSVEIGRIEVTIQSWQGEYPDFSDPITSNAFE